MKKIFASTHFRAVAVIATLSVLTGTLAIAAVNIFSSVQAEAGSRVGNVSVVTDSTASGSAIRFGASDGNVACPAPKRVITSQEVTNLTNSGYAAGTEVYMPGSPDPWGGCFPNENNTGVPSGTILSDYNGTCNITTNGFTLNAALIDHCYTFSINADNVVITNSRFIGSNFDVQSGSLTITDSDADFGSDQHGQGFTGNNITAQRLNFYGGHRQAWCGSCVIEDSYFHSQDLGTNDEAHASAVRTESYTTYRHNTIWCDVEPRQAGGGCSASQTGYPDFGPIHHNTMEKNLIMAAKAAGYCAYGGWNPGKPYNEDPQNATYIQFIDNVMQRGTTANDIRDWQVPLTGKDRYTCGFYGPTTSYRPARTGSAFTGNMWDDGQLWSTDTSSLYYPFHE